MAGRPSRTNGIAVRSSSPAGVGRHTDGLRTSSLLTSTYREMYERHAAMILPNDVIAVLNKAEVRFVLMGAHAIMAGWSKHGQPTTSISWCKSATTRKRYAR